MNHTWLRYGASDELLLFFGGWGMDGRMAGALFERSRQEGFSGDMLAFYDYASPALPDGLLEACAGYHHITLLAWSFGVMAARFVPLPPPDLALALNGTLHPVDALRGIDPAVFTATLDGYGEEGRLRFNRRMCATREALAAFETEAPGRSSADQLKELQALAVRFRQADPAPSWSYHHAIIGGRDLIVPPDRQRLAWQGTPLTCIDAMPHYPFLHLKTLQEVVACAS